MSKTVTASEPLQFYKATFKGASGQAAKPRIVGCCQKRDTKRD